MDNVLTIPESRLFALPFEKDSLRLTLRTLNSNSNFRHSEIPISAYQIRNISFDNEFCILGILFHFEKEERVYLKTTWTHLLVSCSMDTDMGYLSRYAYFAIFRLMSIDIYFDFEKYYWPGFFDVETGKSRFLDIINDRKGLDIYLKEEYSFFIKPNVKLYRPIAEPAIRRPKMLFVDKNAVDILNNNGIGFCLADTFLRSWHSNHFPFLLTYHGSLAADRKNIKTFLGFVITDGESPDYSPMQSSLSKIARKMGSFSKIVGSETKDGQYRINLLDETNLERAKSLFILWQDAICFLPYLPNIYHLNTLGLKNIKMKPRKSDMIPCEFSENVPKICFLWKEHEDYYEISYRFKIGEEIHTPSEQYTAFLISDDRSPRKYYLFNSFSDCLTTMFFGENRFKILILKAHYIYFESYLNYLRANFEIIVVEATKD